MLKYTPWNVSSYRLARTVRLDVLSVIYHTSVIGNMSTGIIRSREQVHVKTLSE